MRYFINFDKTINQLIPYYLGGRKLILYLQALMKPLQELNRLFVEYAKETRIEASMTSQVFYFEWYLNRKFKKYFSRGGRISIGNTTLQGSPLYYQDANIELENHALLYMASENEPTVKLYYMTDRTQERGYSFTINSPAINTGLISTDKYKAMLKFYVEKYRLAGKTYLIKIDS